MRLSRISELFRQRSALSAQAERYLPKPKAEADNADRGLNNSDILRKPNSIIRLLFILQEKSAM